jgi:cell division protein FtsW (lipid II flippase)
MDKGQHAIAAAMGDRGARSRGAASVRPEFFEWLFTLAAIAFLVTQSVAFRDPQFLHGAGDRYQEAIEMRVPVSPAAAGTGRVANICAHFGGWLPEAERDVPAEKTGATGALRWLQARVVGDAPTDRTGVCAADSRHPIQRVAAEELTSQVVAAWSGVHDALGDSFAQPVKARLTHLAELENRAREARAETDVQGAIDSLAGETGGYRDAYGIAAGSSQPAALECAWGYVNRKSQALPADAEANAARVYTLLGMAAILDGDAERAQAAAGNISGTNGDKWTSAETGAGCDTIGSPAQTMRRAAEVVAKARASEIIAGKSAAMQELLTNAPWIFAMWAVLGLVLLQIGRRAVYPHRFVPLALLLWVVSAWIAKVHLEWMDDKALHTAWLMKWGIRWPDAYRFLAGGMALLVIAAFVLPLQRWFNLAPRAPETSSSRLAYAGFVLFTGLGWWLLMDLSAQGHYANRFHALYQQGYVFAAFMLLSVLPQFRLAMAERMGRWFSWFLLLARSKSAGWRRHLPVLTYAGVAAVVLAVAAVVHQSQTQLTSEIFRLWLVFGVSWFFFVRGESALAFAGGGAGAGGGAWRSLGFIWPLLFALFVPMFGLVLTDDFGPLIVMLYAASIFVGAGVAFAVFDREGYRPWLGAVAGVAVAGAWVYLATLALFSLPAPAARIAERLASVRNPFTAANDQLAIITWFQESAPSDGYGFGGVPWCGEIVSATCRGVPRQIQSDYVFTALSGVFGKAIAVALVGVLVAWLVRVVANHGRATRGMVDLASPLATQQAWLSWISICWVGLTLAQLSITVAGNLGWLPLTGITFPFVSFGVWSLLMNTFFLSLAINLPRKT